MSKQARMLFGKFGLVLAGIFMVGLFGSGEAQAQVVVSSLSPSSGAIGATIQINGSGFGAYGGFAAVKFSGVTATIVAPTGMNWTNTSIKCIVPAGISGTVQVQVTNSSNVTSTPGPSSAFTVSASAPSISTLSPSSGPVGLQISVNGSNFGASQGGSTITLAGSLITPDSWSNTQILFTVPSGASSGNVQVSTSGGPSNTVAFTVSTTPVITGLSPSSGYVGDTITISGAGFGGTQGASTVAFNGTNCAAGDIVSWSNTSLQVKVPSGASTGNVVVTVGGSASSGSSFTVLPMPSITSLSPSSGLVSTAVTINGTAFGASQGTGSVSFGGESAAVTSWSATAIQATVPGTVSPGSAAVIVTTGAGKTSNSATYTVSSDSTPPTLPTVTIASSNASTARAKTGDTVTLSITASEPITTPTVTIAGHAATVSGSGSSWSASYVMASGDTEGTVTFNIAYSDIAGNPGTAVTATTNASAVTFDKTPPVTTPSSLGGTYGAPLNVSLTADESATIYYTTTGSDPNEASPQYSTQIPITATTSLKFFAKDVTGNAEAIRTENYVINIVVPDTTPPAAPGNIEARTATVQKQLVLTWTTPSDSDFSHIHIYRSATAGVLGSLAVDNVTGITYTDTGLTGLTTYYYTVRAVDLTGNESTNTAQVSGTTIATDITPPGIPTGQSVTDAQLGGTVNVRWTNPADADFSHVHIFRSTSQVMIGQPATLVADDVTGTSYTDTGLTNGAVYYYVIRASDSSGNVTTNSWAHDALIAVPTPKPDTTAPTGLVACAGAITDPATGGTLVHSWTRPADPDFATLRIYRSTASGTLGSLVYSGSGTTFTDTALTSNSTCYYTYRSADVFGNETTNTDQCAAIPTDTVKPLCPTAVTATRLADGKIRLDWVRSASSDIAYYNIHTDGGTGTISYGSTAARIAAPAVTWTSGALTADTPYLFTIRPEDAAGNVQTSSCGVISVTPVADPTFACGGMASIKVPPPGRHKVGGNSLTVMAEPACGKGAYTANVRFQYKAVADTSWVDIPSTMPSQFPNPDTTTPYFIHWDVTGLANGDYNLRAVGTSSTAITDPSPATTTIVVDNVAPDIKANAGVTEQPADANAPTTAVLGTVSVTVPEGALSSDTTVTITQKDATTESSKVALGYTSGGTFVEIVFASGQHILDNSKRAVIELPYTDDDNDGIIDGTSIRATDLKVCDYSTTTLAWTCYDSVVDTSKKVVRAKSPTFSLFGLLKPPSLIGQGWNVASVPLTPAPATPAAVFGTATLLTNKIYWWNATAQDWALASTITPGVGYYLWGGGTGSYTAAGTETPDAPQTIALKKGWNLIGHPFRYKVKVADLTVTNGSTVSLQQAQSNGWVAATAYLYVNGAYQYLTPGSGGMLEAWKGYWMLSDVDCTLTIPNTPAQ